MTGTMPAVDLAKLIQLNLLNTPGNSEPFAARAAKVFLKTAPGLVDKMRLGYYAQDAVGIRIASHTLKTSSHFLGAIELSQLANRLEISCRENSLSGADELIIIIEREYPRVAQELEQFVLSSQMAATSS